MPDAQKGYILIADISGYTRFLTKSELEHAHEIIRELMKLIREHMGAPVQVIRSEGDALFGYLPANCLDDAPWLLDLVEATYHSFRDRLFKVEVASTCDCNACKNVQELDLKFFAHHGEFIVEDLGGGRPDLSGAEVILAHRLLKNDFREKNEVLAYFMVTNAIFQALDEPEGAIAHTEEIEHFGTVGLHVFDLAKALTRRREKSRVLVVKEHADLWFERVVEAPRSVVWNHVTDPRHIASHGSGLTGWTWKGDRREEGGQAHCAHDDGSVSVMQIADWTPMDHFTLETQAQGMFFPAVHITTHCVSLPRGRTQLCYGARVLKPSFIQAGFFKLFKGKLKQAIEAGWDELEKTLADTRDVWMPHDHPHEDDDEAIAQA